MLWLLQQGAFLTEHEFFLPVHGFISVNEKERKVIDHPAFQRLGRIYQLGQTHLVYRGATHKRLEHAIGALGVAQKMIRSIKKNHKRHRGLLEEERRVGRSQTEIPNDWRLAEDLNRAERAFIRLAALLHDIGRRWR